MRGKNTMQNKPTFNQILKQTERKNSETLMAKARLANRLAKQAKGENRKNAYAVKSNALLFLVNKMPRKVNISKDFRYDDHVLVTLRGKQFGLHLPKEQLR